MSEMGGILKRTNLDKVPDLSDGVQSKLEGIGITTTELLANVLPEEISSKIGIPRERSLGRCSCSTGCRHLRRG